MVQPRWTTGPAALTLVRHAHSQGNHADARAREAGAEELDLPVRDAEVDLSETGRAQADALRRWLAERDAVGRPTVVLTSPYLRARRTADRAVAGLGLDVVDDERLRERDLGRLHGLTEAGITARHPEEAERRRRVGGFYYRPPSGESWCDLALRVRSLLQDLRAGYDDARVWLFTHQAVVMTFRYVLEGLPGDRLPEIDRDEQLPNASLTRYRRTGESFRREWYADTRALTAGRDEGEWGTSHTDRRDGGRPQGVGQGP